MSAQAMMLIKRYGARSARLPEGFFDPYGGRLEIVGLGFLEAGMAEIRPYAQALPGIEPSFEVGASWLIRGEVHTIESISDGRRALIAYLYYGGVFLGLDKESLS